MTNFHSTTNLRIERSPSQGVRVTAINVKNAPTKGNKITTFINKNLDMSDGDIYRAFFKKLDDDEVKTMQGGILRCDKKKLYYVDDTFEFPKGLSFDVPTSNTTGKPHYKYKTAYFENGLTVSKTPIYKSVNFVLPPIEGTTVEVAKYIKNNLQNLRLDTGEMIVEYDEGCFEKVPDPGIKLKGKFPQKIKIKSVNSNEEVIKVAVETTTGIITFDYSIKHISNKLFKTVYSFFVARDIFDGKLSDIVTYNKEFDVFEVPVKKEKAVEDSSEKVEEKIEEKFIDSGSVIFNPNSDEAKSLVGKRVYYSNSINTLDSNVGILHEIENNNDFPFVISLTHDRKKTKAIFIKKAPELEAKCYNFDDFDTRTMLFGLIFKTKNTVDVEEEMVTSFKKVNDRWLLNGKYTSYKFKNECVWRSDSTPCGIIEEAE